MWHLEWGWLGYLEPTPPIFYLQWAPLGFPRTESPKRARGASPGPDLHHVVPKMNSAWVIWNQTPNGPWLGYLGLTPRRSFT